MREDDQPLALGTLLRRLLELLDGDLETVYAETLPGYRPRFTPVMKCLADGGARTISAIASQAGVSQPAASQTVARMAAEGFVELEAGADGRERRVSLTPRGRELLPPLRAQWARTDAAARELETEIGAPLSEIAAAAIRALEARPFGARVRARNSGGG